MSPPPQIGFSTSLQMESNQPYSPLSNESPKTPTAPPLSPQVQPPHVPLIGQFSNQSVTSNDSVKVNSWLRTYLIMNYIKLTFRVNPHSVRLILTDCVLRLEVKARKDHGTKTQLFHKHPARPDTKNRIRWCFWKILWKRVRKCFHLWRRLIYNRYHLLAVQLRIIFFTLIIGK